jgi:hypothetical protein
MIPSVLEWEFIAQIPASVPRFFDFPKVAISVCFHIDRMPESLEARSNPRIGANAKMSGLILRMSLLFCLASPFWGQTDEWKTYKNTDGNFSVLLPGPPKDELVQKDAASETHTILAQTSAGYGYSVVYTSIAAEHQVDDVAFASFRDGVFNAMAPCKVTSDGPVSLVVQGYIGHFYRLSCPFENATVNMVANLYVGKHYGYFVMIAFKSSLADPPETRKFLNSFSVIDAAK